MESSSTTFRYDSVRFRSIIQKQKQNALRLSGAPIGPNSLTKWFASEGHSADQSSRRQWESDMKDETESVRRAMLASGQPYRDLAKVKEHMRWSTEELRIDFEVLGFMAPFVVVKRKFDGVKGTMEFTHDPRWYFNFVPDNGSYYNDNV
jgi:hypothetical protein